MANDANTVTGLAQPASALNCNNYLFTLDSGVYSVRLGDADGSGKSPFAVAFFGPPTSPGAQAGFLSFANGAQSSVVLTPESRTALCQVTGNAAQLYINEYSVDAVVTGDRSITVALLDLATGQVKQPAGPAVIGISEIVAPAVIDAPPVPALTVSVQIEGSGERVYSASQWAGAYDRPVKLEGFTLAFNGVPSDLNIEYLCGNAELGLTPWVKAGRYCGSRGKGIALTKFAIRLSGPAVEEYDVQYKGHFIGYGDSFTARNGEICQAPENQPLAAIYVEVLKAGPGVAAGSDAEAITGDPDRAIFDEYEYLRLYPDVSTSVSLREIESGYAHYVAYGRAEGRVAPRLPHH